MGAVSSILTTLDGQNVVDPNKVAEYVLSLDQKPWWDGLVNRFDLPRGFHPGTGAVLISGRTKALIDSDSTSHTLVFRVNDSTTRTVTINDLVITDIEAVTGPSFTADTIYVVHLADKRIFGRFSGGVGGSYNVRAPDDVSFFASTISASWVTIFADLWSKTPFGAIDTSNALFPSSLPENLSWLSTRTWDALEKLCQITNNHLVLETDGTFSLVHGGYADASHTTKLTTFSRSIIRDSNNSTPLATNIPATFRVYFPAHNYQFQYGVDLLQPTYMDFWRTHCIEYVDVTAASLGFAGTPYPGTTHVLYGARTATFDVDGVWSNEADCQADAQSIAGRYVSRYMNGTRFKATYKTACNFEPTSTVAAVSWWDNGAGIRTQVFQDQNFVAKTAGGGSPSSSQVAALDVDHIPALSRETLPFDRFMVVELLDDVEPNNSANANPQWAVGEPPTWSQTALPHVVEVWDIYGCSYRRGDRVVVQWNQQWYEWMIITTLNDIVFFQLYEDLKINEVPGLAQVLTFDSDLNEWSATDRFIYVYDDYPKDSMFTGFANAELKEASIGVGDRGFGMLRQRHPDTGIDDYTIIFCSGPAHAVRFTLSSGRSSGAPDEALGATHDAFYLYGHDFDNGEAFTIWFPSGFFPRAFSGATGVAKYNDRELRYEVWQCDQIALFGTAILSSNICGDSTAAIEEAAPGSFWPFSTLDDSLQGGSGTVLNLCGHYGKAGDVVQFIWVDYLEQYNIFDVEKHEIEVVTSQQTVTVPGEGGNDDVCYTQMYFQPIATELCEDGEWRNVEYCCCTPEAVGTTPISDTDCCPGDPVNTTLYMHFSNKTGSGTTYPDTVPLYYVGNPAVDIWQTVAVICPDCTNSGQGTLTCNGDGSWSLSSPNLCGVCVPDTATCNPFELDFGTLDVSGTQGGTAGTVDLIINDVP